MNTNRNLVRVTTKSKSEMQTVSNGDRSQVILKAMFNGEKTYDNQLRNYNKVRELHIENGTAGSQAQVSYRGVIRRASVTKAAVCMGVTEMGMQTENRGTYNRPPVRDPDQEHIWALQGN